MKKICSLIKACMTNDMEIFKIKTNKKNKLLILIFIAFCFMFAIWSYAETLFEKMAPLNLQHIVLSVFVFMITIFTIAEGIYKTGPLIFNCKDDQLLLSLPIERKTVLFVRIFKFYVFELLFNLLLFFPLIVSYVSWANNIEWTYYLTSAVMIFVLPIIPIIISCIIGAIISGLSSRFKYKNAAQIIITLIFIVFMMYLYFNLDHIIEYLAENATSINDLITKIYYPAGLYATLAVDFSALKLIIFIVVNIILFIITILILSKFYFKINSRIKKVTASSNVNVDELVIKSNSVNKALVKKELTTFFKTPVFIINAGFALFLFIITCVVIAVKFDSFLPMLIAEEGLNIEESLIMNNLSIFIFALISAAAYMTSITNSVISLEGRNINIIKSLPVNTKTILMSKIYSGLTLTTPVLVLGVLILIIRFKISIIESLLLLLLSILVPLVSHYIGLLINLKFPKLDAENSTQVVKQSTSSLVSVLMGMVLLILSIYIILKIVGVIDSTLLLLIATLIYLVIDFILYLLTVKIGVKEFDKLTI